MQGFWTSLKDAAVLLSQKLATASTRDLVPYNEVCPTVSFSCHPLCFFYHFYP